MVCDLLIHLLFIYYEEFPLGFHSVSLNLYPHQQRAWTPFVCVIASIYHFTLQQSHPDRGEATSHSDFILHVCRFFISFLSVPTLDVLS